MNRRRAIKAVLSTIAGVILLRSTSLSSQTIQLATNQLEAIGVSLAVEKLEGKDVVKVAKDSAVTEFDEPTFAKIRGIEFKDGTIEVKVRSRLLKDAPDFSRGFIGIAFRINDANSKFEGIYLRPTNARADDQLRRNRSIQYFSFPDYKFERLRKEAPGTYESYADMGMDEWITMKVEVRGRQAKLFLNENKQPSLIVNDLKHGENSVAAIGLWVDAGTEGFFTDLKVHHE